ncbi:PAS domain S-box protein [Ideonella sp.]|uniref:PAS domain-containing sensor histidine kinase n=1 Tax=Ideonella sp. TaxID=1929293 RepID=UPI003BB55245
MRTVSNDWLQQAQAIAQIGSWELDPRSGFLRWSDEMFRIYGHPASGHQTPEDCLATVLPEDAVATQAAYLSAMAQNRPLDLIHRVQIPGGPLKHVRVLGRFTYGADGSPIRAVGTAQDVTALVSAQATLQSSEAKQRALLRSLAEGVVVHDLDGRVVEANPAACEILGLSLDELLGVKSVDPRWHAVHEDGTPWPGLEHPAMMALRSGLPQRGKVMGINTPQDGLRWIAINACPIRSEGSLVTSGVGASFADITELHQARADLKRINAEQASVLSTDLIGLLKVRNRRFVWVSQGAASMLGYAPQELIGAPTRLIYASDDDFNHVGAVVKTQMQPGQTVRFQLEMIRKDGTRLWVDMSAEWLSVESGESLGVLVDITPLKRAEAARIRVAQLDAENAQLTESNRIKDEFLANMSHEFRTPLNAVIGFSHLLQDSPMAAASPRHAGYLRQIGESGEQLLLLVQSMLDFARVSAGGMTFSLQALNTDDAIAEVADALAPRCAEAGVVLRASTDPALSSVTNDPLRLHQMLMHLLGNAVKFSRPGGLVTAHASPLDAARWCVEVTDQGIGIHADDLQRIFMPFLQLSTGTTRAYGGAGMGLTLAREIARAQGGEIEVQSQPGQGSTFRLILPLVVGVGLPAADALWPQI